jgi:hypothetical protein
MVQPRRMRGKRVGQSATNVVTFCGSSDALRSSHGPPDHNLPFRVVCVAVFEPVAVHDSSYASHSNKRRKSQSRYRRHDRQRARVVRFRRLRLLGHDNVAALLPRRRQDRIAAQGLCRLRRWLRHAAGRFGPIRHLWRSIWQALGLERGYFSHGIFNGGNRATADLRPSWGVLAPFLLVVFKLLGLSAGGEWG